MSVVFGADIFMEPLAEETIPSLIILPPPAFRLTEPELDILPALEILIALKYKLRIIIFMLNI